MKMHYGRNFAVIVLIIIYGCADNGITDISGPSGYNFTDIEAKWSTDGSRIVYVHQDTSTIIAGVYVIDTNGTNKRIVLSGYEENPDWSPDGVWIVFSNTGQIYKIKISGDSLTQLTSDGNNYFPTWSNDGVWIAYDSDIGHGSGDDFYSIWKMRIDGSNKIRLTTDTTSETREPNWASNKIVYIRYNFYPQIYIMDTNGSANTSVTNNPLLKDLPNLSSDGTKITFTVSIQGPQFQIWTVNKDGSNLKLLTTYSAWCRLQGYAPSWSPDGNYIVYTDSAPKNGRLWIMDKNGNQKKQITF